METDFERRVFAYECAKGDIPLARQYVGFLNEAKDREDLEMRIRSIDMRKGCDVMEIDGLLRFLDGSEDV